MQDSLQQYDNEFFNIDYQNDTTNQENKEIDNQQINQSNEINTNKLDQEQQQQQNMQQQKEIIIIDTIDQTKQNDQSKETQIVEDQKTQNEELNVQQEKLEKSELQTIEKNQNIQNDQVNQQESQQNQKVDIIEIEQQQQKNNEQQYTQNNNNNQQDKMKKSEIIEAQNILISRKQTQQPQSQDSILEAQYQEKEVLLKEISQLKKQNKNLVGQLRDLNDKLTFILKQKEITKSSNKNNKNQINLEETLIAVKMELDNAYKMVSTYQKENKKLTAKISDNQQVFDKIVQLENTISEKNKQIESLKQELKTVQKISRNLETALSTSNNNLSNNNNNNLNYLNLGTNNNNSRYLQSSINCNYNNSNSNNNASLFFEKASKNQNKQLNVETEDLVNGNQKLIEKIQNLQKEKQAQIIQKSINSNHKNVSNDSKQSNVLLKEFQENYQTYNTQNQRKIQRGKSSSKNKYDYQDEQQQLPQQNHIKQLVDYQQQQCNTNSSINNNNINQTLNSVSCDDGDQISMQINTIQSEKKDNLHNQQNILNLQTITTKQNNKNNSNNNNGHHSSSKQRKFKSQISSDDQQQIMDFKASSKESSEANVDDLKLRVKEYHLAKITWEKKYKNEIKSYQSLVQQQQDAIIELKKKLHIQNIESNKLKMLTQQQIQSQFLQQQQQQQMQQQGENSQNEFIQPSISTSKNKKEQKSLLRNDKINDSIQQLQLESPQKIPNIIQPYLQTIPHKKLKLQKQRELSNNKDQNDNSFNNESNKNQINQQDSTTHTFPNILQNNAYNIPSTKAIAKSHKNKESLLNKSYQLPKSDSKQLDEYQDDTQFIKNKMTFLKNNSKQLKQNPSYHQQQQIIPITQNPQQFQQQQQQFLLSTPIKQEKVANYPNIQQQEPIPNTFDFNDIYNINQNSNSENQKNNNNYKSGTENSNNINVPTNITNKEIATSTRSLITNNNNEEDRGQSVDIRSPEELLVSNILKGIKPLSLRDIEYGKEEKFSKRFNDKIVLRNNYSTRICKIIVWHNESGIAGIKANYKILAQNKVIEGQSNVISNSKLKENSWDLNDGCCIKQISGMFRQDKKQIVSLTITNNEGEQKTFGNIEDEEKQNEEKTDKLDQASDSASNLQQFQLDIDENEIPICIHGALNAIYDDQKDELNSELCLIGVQVIKEEINKQNNNQ